MDSSLGKIVWHEVVTLKWSWAEMAMGGNNPEPVPCFSILQQMAAVCFFPRENARETEKQVVLKILCECNISTQCSLDLVIVMVPSVEKYLKDLYLGRI